MTTKNSKDELRLKLVEILLNDDQFSVNNSLLDDLESLIEKEKNAARIDELEGLPVSGLITMGGVRQDVITELEVSRRIKELKEKP